MAHGDASEHRLLTGLAGQIQRQRRPQSPEMVPPPDAAHLLRYQQLVGLGDQDRLNQWLSSRAGTNLAAKRAPYEAAMRGTAPVGPLAGVSPPGYPAGPMRPVVPGAAGAISPVMPPPAAMPPVMPPPPSVQPPQQPWSQMPAPNATQLQRYRQLVTGGDQGRLEAWLSSRGGTNLATKRAPYEAAYPNVTPPPNPLGGMSPPGYPPAPRRRRRNEY